MGGCKIWTSKSWWMINWCKRIAWLICIHYGDLIDDINKWYEHNDTPLIFSTFLKMSQEKSVISAQKVQVILRTGVLIYTLYRLLNIKLKKPVNVSPLCHSTGYIQHWQTSLSCLEENSTVMLLHYTFSLSNRLTCRIRQTNMALHPYSILQ